MGDLYGELRRRSVRWGLICQQPGWMMLDVSNNYTIFIHVFQSPRCGVQESWLFANKPGQFNILHEKPWAICFFSEFEILPSGKLT